ncbi:unnamed protein product [Mycetohabitans rhizoxinica HKI 454]|uniref:Uncharacterized protein n=1 Tax=Mycetohabitans rhizoxinica (strain DSM 19002 / CIP 109453 / HKI 454) TaxID=882378 RepID=E5AQA8_MYCRK|nr:unnamed protein product [Mycetohabitans rhizoxinica HKI 454]
MSRHAAGAMATAQTVRRSTHLLACRTAEGLWTGTLSTLSAQRQDVGILAGQERVVHQAAGTYAGLRERPIRHRHPTCSGACSGAARPY